MAPAAAATAFRHQQPPRAAALGLAGLAANATFDAAYFREVNPAWEGVDDLGCARAWLMGAAAPDQPASPAAHLRRLGLPGEAYPSCFPWRRYARGRPQAGAHRWAALDDFVATGGQHAGTDMPFGSDAAGLLAAVARQWLGRDDASAIRLYERADALAPLAAPDLQHLADAYLRRQSWRVAAGLYDAIIAAGAADGWTWRNRVHCAAGLGTPESVLPALRRARADPRIQASTDPPWRGTVDLMAEHVFNRRLRDAEALLATHGPAAAEAALGDAVEAAIAIHETLAADGPSFSAPGSTPGSAPGSAPAAAMPAPGDRVLLLADLGDAEAAERRVRERVRRLAALGVAGEVVAVSAAHTAADTPPPARLLLLFAAPAVPGVIKAVLTARRRGIPTCYETAEDITPAATERALNGWLERMGPEERDGRIIAAGLRRAAARLCDFAVAPTARLAAGPRSLTRARTAFVVRDSYLPPAGPRHPPAAADGPAPLLLRARQPTILAPEPGSIGAPLLAALRRWPTLRLLLCGPFRLDLRFDGSAAQIVRPKEPREEQPEATAADGFPHWDALAAAGLHLAWSDGTADADAAAEIACAEAAALGVPSLLYAPTPPALSAPPSDPGDPTAAADQVEAVVVRDPGAWTRAVANFLAAPLAWARRGEDAARGRAPPRRRGGHARTGRRAGACRAPRRPARRARVGGSKRFFLKKEAKTFRFNNVARTTIQRRPGGPEPGWNEKSRRSVSASRIASATMVSVGLAYPDVGNTELPAT